MIRHDRVIADPALPADDPGRFHRSALSEHDVAGIVAGVAFSTWRGKRAVERAAFKARVPSLTTPSDRKDAYDPEQVAAYVDPSRQMPALTTQDADLPDDKRHPDDLLTDHEAAAWRGTTVKSLRDHAVHGHLTGAVEIAGVRFWPRRVLTRGTVGRSMAAEDALDEIKKRGAAARRGERGPVTIREIKDDFGLPQTTARRYLERAQLTAERTSPAQAAARIRERLDAAGRGERGPVTHEEIKSEFAVSQATAARYLAHARRDQIREWLDAAGRGERGPVTHDEIQARLGVSQATAARYLAHTHKTNSASS
ncbi:MULTISPECIES: hypothetical protein [Streptomyces]|uniref:hypothetical protein n=1 Tax=Streptomyces TaxID=1883 RepID=UPI0004C6A527|nr:MULTISPECIES: hypothetical protein [Streptomyces]